ncbi:MAG: sigma factor [Solirubrobacteraceae bacterium]
MAALHERARLLAAQREDRRAQREILRRNEPLARAIARRLRMPPGCDRREIAQEARLGLLAAIRAWRPQCGPFPAFARLCALDHARNAIDAAGARKHQLLS